MVSPVPSRMLTSNTNLASKFVVFDGLDRASRGAGIRSDDVGDISGGGVRGRRAGIARRLGSLRCRYTLLFVHGEKQVIGKRALPSYMPSPQIKVDVGTHGKPHVLLLAVESYRAEFDIYVFREKLDLWHSRLQIGFDANYLTRILLDPRPTLERNGGQRAIGCGTVASQTAWYPGLLRKMNLPGAEVFPSSQSFALYVIVVAVVGMKNQDHRGKTDGGNRVWKHTQICISVPKLLDAKMTGAYFRNGNHMGSSGFKRGSSGSCAFSGTVVGSIPPEAVGGDAGMLNLRSKLFAITPCSGGGPASRNACKTFIAEAVWFCPISDSANGSLAPFARLLPNSRLRSAWLTASAKLAWRKQTTASNS